MSDAEHQSCLAGQAALTGFFSGRTGFSLLVLTLVMSLCVARADEKEDEYLRIYEMVQTADTLNASGKSAAALEKYRTAFDALRKFKVNHREWNAKSVDYRLNYLREKITSLSGQGANPTEGTASSSTGSGAGTGPQVKLLEAGTDPRKALRLHPKPGDKETLVIAVKIGMGLKMGETENPPMKMPGMNLTLELTVKDVSERGDISYETQISDASIVDEPGALPQLAESMKSATENLKGLSGTGTMSNRGLDKGTEFKVAADADPQIRQAIDQMKDTVAEISVPFPEEPLGPGAKWEVSRQIKSQGMTIDQKGTYELASLEGERVNINSTIIKHAANQKIENPAMPGVKVDLTSMDGKGTGKLSRDLGQLLPSTGNIDSQSEMVMGMNLGPQKQDMTLKLTVSISLESK